MPVTYNYFHSDEWIKYRQNKIVTLCSGGLDPIHRGHLQYLIAAAKLGDILIVVINGNGFLIRKKGFAFQDQYERAFIAENIVGVDKVLIRDDGTQFVDGAIRLIKPDYFAKGGDRSKPENLPTCEIEAAECVGCSIVYGIGGTEKINSSSELAANLKKLTKQA